MLIIQKYDDEQKRDTIKNLLWNLTIKDKNIVNIKYKSVFEVIAKRPKNESFVKCSAFGTKWKQF